MNKNNKIDFTLIEETEIVGDMQYYIDYAYKMYYPFINNLTSVDKIVGFSHTPTIRLHDSESIWYEGDKDIADNGQFFTYSTVDVFLIFG